MLITSDSARLKLGEDSLEQSLLLSDSLNERIRPSFFGVAAGPRTKPVVFFSITRGLLLGTGECCSEGWVFSSSDSADVGAEGLAVWNTDGTASEIKVNQS